MSRIQKLKEDMKDGGKKINKREDKLIQKKNEKKETGQEGKIDIRVERKRKINKQEVKKHK